MKNKYSQHIATPKRAPQNEPIPFSGQVANNGGGYSWEVDNWKQLDRFLLLGSESGTHYVSEKKLTQENAKSVIDCIKNDGIRTINRTIEISKDGRAAKNDPAIFVLALATVFGNEETKQLVYNNLSKVCRISTHLFHFAQYVDDMRGWGSGLRKAIARWYTNQSEKDLAYQIVKYVQRDGWSHRDLLRLSHPSNASLGHSAIFRYVTGGIDSLGERNITRKVNKKEISDKYPNISAHLPEMIKVVDSLSDKSDLKYIITCIEDYNLPHEVIPTDFKNKPEIWESILNQKMPLGAMVRNLANMTRIGTLAPFNSNTKKVIETLGDIEQLKKSRLHPIALLNAQKTYASGVGQRGTTWKPISQIVDALNDALYNSFKLVAPTNKSFLLALDVSTSMTWNKCGGTNITPREGAAAMALVTANAEKNYHILGFSHELVDLGFSCKTRLDDAMKIMNGTKMGATNCSLPMQWALKNKVNVDVFCIYTDSETNFGEIHPAQALKQYRNEVNPNAKLIVIGMEANKFSIADPKDSGMLDLVGFDTNTPSIISEFSIGNI